MGRDLEGGNEVNLIKRDKPGDVYTKVCNMVIESIKNEINSGILESNELEVA